MINDTERYTIDRELKLLLIDGEPDITVFKDDMVTMIKEYIEDNGIASIGVTIVHSNAKMMMSAPSDDGTMLNLYTLFDFYYNVMEY